MIRTITLAAVAAALALAGCSSAAADDDGPYIDADGYYDLMRGMSPQFELYDDDSLDDIGRAFCSDMSDLDGKPDQQRGAVLVLREQAYDDLSAFGLVLAMAGRHCPEYIDLWDDEVRSITGEDDLPWDEGSDW